MGLSVSRPSPRALASAALGAALLLAALVVCPVGFRWMRAAEVVLAAALLGVGFVAAWPRRALRLAALAATAAVGLFLVLPGRARPDAAALRAAYVAAVRRYEGTRYVWGGEGALGIDCSGLARRGLIDAELRRGVATLDPASVRAAASLWWNDCTARSLGDGSAGLTVPVGEAPSLDAADPSACLPGDLAVTVNGLHVMIAVGAGAWIEADPGLLSVVVVTTPSPANPWFGVPVRFVRWRRLT